MGFQSAEVIDKAREFKMFLKRLGIKRQRWAVNTEISENAAYGYFDIDRVDNNLPAFLIPDLPADHALDVINYLQSKLSQKTLFKEIGHVNNKTIIKHFSRFMASFCEFGSYLIAVLENDNIDSEDITLYQEKRAEFVLMDIRLGQLMKALCGDKWEE